MSRPVITRFAPSPTGYIHVGNLRTALMNYLIARKSGGSFILRLDDTDQERSKQEYADGIMADLDWLGLHWDRVERQSLRYDRYRAAADKLRAEGRFYECFETPTELDLKRKKLAAMNRPPVYDRGSLKLAEAEKAALREAGVPGYWRFLLNQTRIEWVDGIIGPLSIDAASVSDPVLIRADGQVLYTFASSVDDIEMGVSNIVRGADHVTNTATQIQIMQALGGTPPDFAHHSLLTGAQGEELSKRLGTLSLRDLRARGVEPMALLSLMARLGSSKPVELAGSIDELAAGFEVESFGAAPTKFDAEDLFPLTRAYVQGLPFAAVQARICGPWCARRSGRGFLGGRQGQHHRAGRSGWLVASDPRRGRAAGRRCRSRFCGAGLRDAATAALVGRDLGPVDGGREGGDGPQGQGPVPPAAPGADGPRCGPRDGRPDAAFAPGPDRLRQAARPGLCPRDHG